MPSQGPGVEEERKSEVGLRQMEIDDIAAVYHLGEGLFTSEEFPILYRTWDPNEVTSHFITDPDYCLVAETEHKVVGFILGTTFEKEGTAWKRYGYVSWIGVDEAFQRTGLARRLYRRLEERLREFGGRMIIADTEGGNQDAIAFFQTMGFTPRVEHVWLAKTLQPRTRGANKGKGTATPTRRPRPKEMTRGESMDVQPERLRGLLKDLVDIYSPSGKEGEVLRFAEQYLKKHGLSVSKQKVDDSRFNLMVMPEKTDEAQLCFVGHLDTVTAYDIEEYAFRQEGDRMSGLGTVDMKAGCAAMMEAFTVLAHRQDPFPPVALSLVVGEEEEGDGAKALVREFSFPWAVIGEPTNMVPCLGHYAYLEVLLRTRGKRAHSSMPQLGQNAIENMLRLLLQVTEYATSLPQGLVYNIRQFSGFPSGFVVPDRCEAWLDLHLPPDSRIDVLKAELEELVKAARKNIPALDAYIKFEETYSGYRISPERPLIRRLQEVYQRASLPWELQDFRSHSDGNVLWNAGVDPIILGPGRLEAAHTTEESIDFSQVLQAAQLYVDFALSL